MRRAVQLFRECLAAEGVRELGFGLNAPLDGHPETGGFSWAMILESGDDRFCGAALSNAWAEANDLDVHPVTVEVLRRAKAVAVRGIVDPEAIAGAAETRPVAPHRAGEQMIDASLAHQASGAIEDLVHLIGFLPPRAGLCVSFAVWEAALRLAAFYGWTPAGTTPPAELWGDIDPVTGDDRLEEACAEWSGSYLTRQHQAVGLEDASALAEALERAMVDVPDPDGPRHAWSGTGCARPELLNWFSVHKRSLRDLAAFCAENDFEIQ